MLTTETYKNVKYDTTKSEHQQFIRDKIWQFKQDLEELKPYDLMTIGMCAVTTCFTTSLCGTAYFGLFKWIPLASEFFTGCSIYSSAATGGVGGFRLGKTQQYQAKLKELIEIYHWMVKDAYPSQTDQLYIDLIKTIGPFIISQKDLLPHDLDQAQIDETVRQTYDQNTYLRFRNLSKYFEKAANRPKLQQTLVWVDAARELSMKDIKMIMQMFLYGNYTLDDFTKGNGPLSPLRPTTRTMTRS